MRVSRSAPLLAAAALLAGCSALSSLNPMNWWGGDSSGPKPAPLPEIKPTLTIQPVWRAGVGNAGTWLFVPAVRGDTVYAAAADGTLAAMDLTRGTQKWRIQANRAGLSAGVAASADLVVVGTPKGEVLAFDSTGREKWRALVSSEVLAPPLIVDDVVYARTSDNRVHAFAAADGRRRWVYQRTAPALVLRNFAGLAAADGSLFAGFPGGKLVAIATANGTLRWEGTVALPRGATELERIADVTGPPVLADRMVCGVAYQGRAACFDTTNGTPAWTREVSSQAGMTVDGRFAFVSDDRSAVVGLSSATGTSLWKQDKLLHRGISAPLSIGRAVIVGDLEGYLHALSREDGAFIGRVPTDGSWIAAPPQRVVLPDGEGILVQTRAGGVFVFRL
jgi:outer membrane protein assembly factor BamB